MNKWHQNYEWTMEEYPPGASVNALHTHPCAHSSTSLRWLWWVFSSVWSMISCYNLHFNCKQSLNSIQTLFTRFACCRFKSASLPCVSRNRRYARSNAWPMVKVISSAWKRKVFEQAEYWSSNKNITANKAEGFLLSVSVCDGHLWW